MLCTCSATSRSSQVWKAMQNSSWKILLFFISFPFSFQCCAICEKAEDSLFYVADGIALKEKLSSTGLWSGIEMGVKAPSPNSQLTSLHSMNSWWGCFFAGLVTWTLLQKVNPFYFYSFWTGREITVFRLQRAPTCKLSGIYSQIKCLSWGSLVKNPIKIKI